MHIMVDIEGLGLRESAQVLAIGAAAFEDDRIQSVVELSTSAFLMSIPESAYDRYRDGLFTQNKSTVEWWANQPQEARDALQINLSSHEGALRAFSDWLSEYLLPEGTVWANSPTFDLAILRYHYEVLGLKTPWSFRQERDCRTMFAMFRRYNVFPERYQIPELIPHRADHDAIRQAIAIQTGMDGLRERCDGHRAI